MSTLQWIIGIMISLVLGLLGLVLPWLRSRKELSYEYVVNPILQKDKIHDPDKVKVLYEGKPISDISLIKIKIANSGKVPIKSSDFDHPLFLNFEGRVLSSEIIESNPSNIKTSVKNDSTSLQVEPCLLNPGDFIVISVLVSEYQAFHHDVRIIGVKEIKHDKGLPLLYLGFLFGIGVLISALTPLSIVILIFEFAKGNPNFLLVAIIIGFLTVVVIGMIIILYKALKWLLNRFFKASH